MLTLGKSHFFRVGISRSISSLDCRSCYGRPHNLVLHCLAGDGDGTLSALCQMRWGGGFDVPRDLLPHLDSKALARAVLFLLFRLLRQGGFGVGFLLLNRRRALVEPAGSSGAEEFLGVRRQEIRVFRHAVDQLDGPDIVLLLRLLLLWRGDCDPVLSPLSHG